MRTTWLGVIGALLISVTSLPAQESRVRQFFSRSSTTSTFASEPPMEALPAPANNAPLPPPRSNAAQAAPAPANAGPARPGPAGNAAPPAAVTGHPATNGDAGCGCKCGHGGKARSCLERLRDWFCYRSPRGCCDLHGECGCYVPLYQYFYHDCYCCRHYDMPECCNKKKDGPCLLERLVGSGSCVGQPTGQGCCGLR
jgi:hypothetical protein